MYDALLVVRSGWGKAEFESAAPEFVQAIRAALYAERLTPLLEDAARDAAMDPSQVVPQARPAINRAKMAAAELRDLIRSLLGLDKAG